MRNLGEFYDQLEQHDWWHMMSDDSRVDQRGAADWRRIEALAKDWPEAISLKESYAMYMNSRVNGPALPKPARPQ